MPFIFSEGGVSNMNKLAKAAVDLINESKCEIFAEVGVYQGTTSKAILLSCPSIKEYHMIDPWVVYNEPGSGNMGLVTDEKGWESNYRTVQDLFKDVPNFFIHKLTSVKGSELFKDKFFDIVFIDAIHSYERVYQDIIHWLPKVKTGGILAGDDIYLRGVRASVRDYFGEHHFRVLSNILWAHDVNREVIGNNLK